MKRILSKSRYIVLIPVVMSLIASVVAFIWGGVKTVSIISHLVLSMAEGGSGHGVVELIGIMDTYLIATALFIFAIGMYELFIGDVEFPEWLAIHDLHSLKAKLASVIILVMSVTFLEHLTEWSDGWETLLYAAAVALVTGALIAYGHFGGKD